MTGLFKVWSWVLPYWRGAAWPGLTNWGWVIKRCVWCFDCRGGNDWVCGGVNDCRRRIWPTCNGRLKKTSWMDQPPGGDVFKAGDWNGPGPGDHDRPGIDAFSPN